MIHHGAVLHGFEGGIDVVIAQTFQISVGDNRNGMVTDHAAGVIPGQLPHRKLPAVQVLMNKRFNEIIGARLFNNGVKRMGGAKSIPQGEYSVIGKVFCPVDFKIGASVTPVRIHEYIGYNHRMVKGRVKDGFDLCVRFNGDLLQFPIPNPSRLGSDTIEIPIG